MSIESYLSTQKQQQEPPVSLPPPLTPKPLRRSRLEPYLVSVYKHLFYGKKKKKKKRWILYQNKELDV